MQAILDFAGQKTHVLRGRLPPAVFFPGKMQPPDFGHADQAKFSTIFGHFLTEILPTCSAAAFFAVISAVTTYIRTVFVQFSYHFRIMFVQFS